MSKKSVWAKVEELREKGEEPVINLSPATRVIKPKRATRGRPKLVVDNSRPYAHWESHTPAGQRMRCRAQGCRKKLRLGQILVCSEYCEQELRSSCEMYLAILNGDKKPAELPPYMRSDRLRAVGKRTM